MKFTNLSKKHYLQYKNLIDSNITEEYFNYFIENVLNKNHNIIVIEDNYNNLLGTGTILIEKKLTNDGCNMGHIENILIDEKFRGNGYGELLVNYLLEIGKENKCYRVDLNCTSELEHFYQKNGFEKKHLCMNIYFKENFN
jgi:glucosamine-phosphate N-acetyltransferase